MKSFKFEGKKKTEPIREQEPKKDEPTKEIKTENKDYDFLIPLNKAPKKEPIQEIKQDIKTEKPIANNSPIIKHRYNYSHMLKCPICNKEISNRQALRIHLKLKHNIENYQI